LNNAEPQPFAKRTRTGRTPAGVRLCALRDLADPGARNFVLQIGAAWFHGFLVRSGAQVRGFVDRCPHAGLPLAQKLDDYLTRDGRWIVCAWHGAVFDPRDGACVGGPCADQALGSWPVRIIDGFVVTGEEAG
jgi:nitrite reductase/ring-hydroxylating ferredoxin subunit